MGTSTKNLTKKKNKYNILEERINFLAQRIRDMDESIFGGLVRSEAMINTILQKEIVHVDDFNASLKAIFDNVEENSKKIIDESNMTNEEIESMLANQVTDQVTITVEDKKE